jgi:hypothetical protein
MVDMSRHIVAKSDQLNADDLIGKPRTVTITKVVEYSSPDQPIGLHYEGDAGKPYKPCKGMRRALVFIWGPDGAEYVGRSLTLFHDPSVTWGGEAVGGIRISHASHIRGKETFPISTSKTKRVQYTVEPLAAPKPRRTLEEQVAAYEGAIAKAADLEALATLQQSEGATKLRAKVEAEGGDQRAALLERMTTAGSKRAGELRPADDDGETVGDYDEGGFEDEGFDPGDDDAFPGGPE